MAAIVSIARAGGVKFTIPLGGPLAVAITYLFVSALSEAWKPSKCGIVVQSSTNSDGAPLLELHLADNNNELWKTEPFLGEIRALAQMCKIKWIAVIYPDRHLAIHAEEAFKLSRVTIMGDPLPTAQKDVQHYDVEQNWPKLARFLSAPHIISRAGKAVAHRYF